MFFLNMHMLDTGLVYEVVSFLGLWNRKYSFSTLGSGLFFEVALLLGWSLNELAPLYVPLSFPDPSVSGFRD